MRQLPLLEGGSQFDIRVRRGAIHSAVVGDYTGLITLPGHIQAAGSRRQGEILAHRVGMLPRSQQVGSVQRLLCLGGEGRLERLQRLLLHFLLGHGQIIDAHFVHEPLKQRIPVVDAQIDVRVLHGERIVAGRFTHKHAVTVEGNHAVRAGNGDLVPLHHREREGGQGGMGAESTAVAPEFHHAANAVAGKGNPVFGSMVSQQRQHLIFHQLCFVLHPEGHGIVRADVLGVQLEAIVPQADGFAVVAIFNILNLAVVSVQIFRQGRGCAKSSFKVEGCHQVRFQTAGDCNRSLRRLGHTGQGHRCGDGGLAGTHSRHGAVRGHRGNLSVVTGKGNGRLCRLHHRVQGNCKLLGAAGHHIERRGAHGDVGLLEQLRGRSLGIVEPVDLRLAEGAVIDLHIVHQAVELRIPVSDAHIDILVFANQGAVGAGGTPLDAVQVGRHTVRRAHQRQLVPVGGADSHISAKAIPAISVAVCPEAGGTIFIAGNSQPFLGVVVTQEEAALIL